MTTREKAQAAFDAVCVWLEADLDEAARETTVEATWSDSDNALSVASDLLDRFYCAGPIYGDDARLSRAQALWACARACGRYVEL